MKKQFVCILLAFAFIISLLPGCGGSPDPLESAKPTESAAPAESEASEESEALPANEATVEVTDIDSQLNLSGEENFGENNISTRPGGLDIYPVADGDVSITYYMSFSTNAPNLISGSGDNYAIKESEKLTGVDIDFIDVSGSAYSTSFNLMLASGDYPDMINQFCINYNKGIDNAIDEDIIIDINEYRDFLPNLFYIIDNSDVVAKDTASDTGRRGYLPLIQCATTAPGNGVYIRGDWLNELGLDDPVTIDDYTGVFEAFKTNYDVPYILWFPNTTSSNFSAAYGVRSGYSDLFYQVDGVVKYSPLEQGYKDYLQQMKAWYDAGYINNDFANIASFLENMTDG